MSRFIVPSAAALLAIAGAPFVTRPASLFPADTTAISIAPASAESPDAQRIRQALDAKVTLQYKVKPLTEVGDDLQKRFHVPVAFETKKIEEITDLKVAAVPITLEVYDMTLGAALRHVLRPLNLQHVVKGNTLTITAAADGEWGRISRLYPVRDLILKDNGERDEDSLIGLVTSLVAPQSWDASGGIGGVRFHRDSMIVVQTSDNHEQVSNLLTALREVNRQRQPDATPPVQAVFRVDKQDDAALAALDRKVTFRVQDERLDGAVAQLNRKYRLNLILDSLAVEATGLKPDANVSVDVSNVPLREALRELLTSFGLALTIRDEAIVVVSKERRHHSTRLYPVADLTDLTESRPEAPGAGGLQFDDVPARDYDSIIQVITSTVEPASWSDAGGTGSILAFDACRSIVVSQDVEVHERIADTLAALRKSAVQNATLAPPRAAADKAAMTVRIYPIRHVSERPYPNGEVNPAASGVGGAGGAAEKRRVDQTAGEKGKDAGILKQIGGMAAPAAGAASLATPAETADLICDLIEPKGWKSEEGAYIRATAGAIVVRHRPDVHRQIELLLAHLAAADRWGVAGSSPR